MPKSTGAGCRSIWIFVQAAIAIDTENRDRLIARAMELMGIANPNSRDQFLDWLRGEEVEVDALRKADVAAPARRRT